MARREVPTPIGDWRKNRPADPLESETWPAHVLGETTFSRKPDTAIEALMEAAPGEPVEESLEELHDLREAVIDAVERLDPKYRFVIDAINSERLSLAQLANRMGISKTHAHRLQTQAFAQLRADLSTDTTVRRRLNMKPDSWNAGCRAALKRLEPYSNESDTKHNFQIFGKMNDFINAMTVSTDDVELVVHPAIAMGTAPAGWLDNHDMWDIDSIGCLLDRKQHDYGHENINSFGHFGVVVRLNDKVARLKNLTMRNLLPSNESLIDTYEDIIGYCVILLMIHDNTFQLELDNDFQA